MIDKIRKLCENSYAIMHHNIMYTINYCDDDYVCVDDNDGDDMIIYYDELDLNHDEFFVLIKLNPDDYE